MEKNSICRNVETTQLQFALKKYCSMQSSGKKSAFVCDRKNCFKFHFPQKAYLITWSERTTCKKTGPARGKNLLKNWLELWEFSQELSHHAPLSFHSNLHPALNHGWNDDIQKRRLKQKLPRNSLFRCICKTTSI